MPNLRFELEISPDPSKIEGLDHIPEAIIAQWKGAIEEIALTERMNVRSRTPVDRGALSEAVSSKKGSGNSLMTVYYDTEPQEFEWHRVYAQYQEGPPLGLKTYTNEPRQMLRRADPEDIPDIEEWALRRAAEAVDGLDLLDRADAFAGL